MLLAGRVDAGWWVWGGRAAGNSSGGDTSLSTTSSKTAENTGELLLSTRDRDLQDGAAASDDDETAQDFDLAELADEFGLELFTVKDYKKAFKVFDVSGDGNVDAEELFRVFQMINDPQTMEQCELMIAKVDLDGNGEIDFRELVGMLSSRQKLVTAEQEIQEAFQMLTRNTLLDAQLTHAHLCARLRSKGPDDLADHEIPEVATSMLNFARRGAAGVETCSFEQFQCARAISIATAARCLAQTRECPLQCPHPCLGVTRTGAPPLAAMMLAMADMADSEASAELWGGVYDGLQEGVDAASRVGSKMVEESANPLGGSHGLTAL
jgi:hypothetical protein